MRRNLLSEVWLCVHDDKFDGEANPARARLN